MDGEAFWDKNNSEVILILNYVNKMETSYRLDSLFTLWEKF